MNSLLLVAGDRPLELASLLTRVHSEVGAGRL